MYLPPSTRLITNPLSPMIGYQRRRGDTPSHIARNAVRNLLNKACYVWMFFEATEFSPGSSRTASIGGCASSPTQTLRRRSSTLLTRPSSLFIRFQFMSCHRHVHISLHYQCRHIFLSYHAYHPIRISCNCNSTRLTDLLTVLFLVLRSLRLKRLTFMQRIHEQYIHVFICRETQARSALGFK